MDAAYRNAVARRGHLKKQITAAETAISRLDAWMDMWRELSGTNEQTVTPTVPSPPNPEPAEPRRGLTRAEGAPIIRKLLVDNGSPLQRATLLELLTLNGTPVGGNDPSNNLGTMLWRMKDKFVNLDGYGYWPIDLAYPTAGYTPPTAEEIEAKNTRLDDMMDDIIDRSDASPSGQAVR